MINVNTPPAASGGTRLSAHLRAGIELASFARLPVFFTIATTEMSPASTASPSHSNTHVSRVSRVRATIAAAIAVKPRATVPQPGTAVKEDAHSIGWRVN